MVATAQPICDLGRKAVDFTLNDPEGRVYTLADVRGPAGLLVMFICNHCPYVRAVAERLARDVQDIMALGIGAVAIMPNDYAQYPEDAPAEMRRFADRHGFAFPYLVDESQAVARAYGAVCTPDFFGFNKDLELQYRGRLDASGRAPAAEDARRELYEAMRLVAATGHGPTEQVASVGCSIKWRHDA